MLYQFEPRNLEREVELVLPEQLRFLRGYNAAKQKEVAAALHIDRSTYAHYETGATQPSWSHKGLPNHLLFGTDITFKCGIGSYCFHLRLENIY